MRSKYLIRALGAVIVTAVLSASITIPALADGYGEHDVGVIFAYGGDHGDITLQGGWHKSASGNRFAIFYTADDGQVLYCLEPGNHRDDDSTAVRQDPDYIRNNLSSRFLNGREIENFISLIMTYGYNGSINGGQEVIDMGYFNEPITEAGGTNTVQLYEACQILIWETMVGERDSEFNYVAPDEGFTPARSIHTTSGDSGDAFDQYYDHIVTYVQTHYDIPSFTVRTLNEAYGLEAVKPDEDDVIRFTDNSNGTYMSNWDFDVIDADGNVIDGAAVEKDGEDIAVYLPDDVSDAYLRAEYNVTERGAIAWSSDLSWEVGSPTQDLVQYNIVSPRICYARVGRETGSITIEKTSDYGVIEDIDFEVYRIDNGNRISVGTVTTDADGKAYMDGLRLGNYEVEEISPDRTVCTWNGGNSVSITSASPDVSLNAFNEVSTVIRLHKTDAVTGEDIGYTAFAIYKDLNSDGILQDNEAEDGIEVSDDNGDSYIEFTDIGVGDYIILETEAYGNYEINEEIISVSVTSPEIYDVTCEDDAFGSITLTKVDGNDKDEIIGGAVFAVYVDRDSDGIYDPNTDMIYDVMTDNGDGTYSIEDLPRQDYLVHEAVSPDNYEIDPVFYPVSISINDLDVICSNDPYGTFSNYNGIAGTEFVDASTGDNEIPVLGEEVILTDHVYYQDLIPGQEYGLHMEVKDKETGESLTDEAGNIISSDISFTPSQSDGTADISVTVDSYYLAGKTIVAYEMLTRDGRNVGIHADIDDEDQTLRFPVIGTQATGSNGTSKAVTSTEDTVIVDHVAYSNLIPGRSYRVEGTLMVQSTGEEFLSGGSPVTAVTEFTAEEGDGNTDVRFIFDAGDMEGDVVVYEEVYDVRTGAKITEHKDIDYKGQTVTLTKRFVPQVMSISSVVAVPATGEGVSGIRILGITVLFSGGVICVTYAVRYQREKKKRVN